MIAIVNITKNPKPTGRCRYSLRINEKELCQFWHNREDGLATCLQKARDAWINHELMKMYHFMKPQENERSTQNQD